MTSTEILSIIVFATLICLYAIAMIQAPENNCTKANVRYRIAEDIELEKLLDNFIFENEKECKHDSIINVPGELYRKCSECGKTFF